MISMRHFIEAVRTMPDRLFHATYRKYVPEILVHGLHGNNPNKNWEDSKDVVYLATTPELAESFAESSEKVSDEVFNSGIVIFSIDVAQLDSKRLHKDRNVRYSELNETFEYAGMIPPTALSIYQ